MPRHLPWEILVLKQKPPPPPKDVLLEGETGGLGLKNRTTATARAPSAPNWHSHTPGLTPIEAEMTYLL